jgi:hypothetical protein
LFPSRSANLPGFACETHKSRCHAALLGSLAASFALRAQRLGARYKAKRAINHFTATIYKIRAGGPTLPGKLF